MELHYFTAFAKKTSRIERGITDSDLDEVQHGKQAKEGPHWAPKVNEVGSGGCVGKEEAGGGPPGSAPRRSSAATAPRCSPPAEYCI